LYTLWWPERFSRTVTSVKANRLESRDSTLGYSAKQPDWSCGPSLPLLHRPWMVCLRRVVAVTWM